MRIRDPYAVPFRLDRQHAPQWFALENTSDETLAGLSFSLLGTGIMRATAPLRLEPRQEVRLSIRGRQLPRSAVLVVRWFRPDGDEYLWRVTF